MAKTSDPVQDTPIRRHDNTAHPDLIELRKRRLRAARVVRKNRRRAARENLKKR